jgi:hypothetical protein
VICLYTDIQGSPLVGYLAVIAFERNAQPDLLITLEQNMLGLNPFLCAFHDGQHHNFGPMEEWRDLTALIIAAMQRAAAFGISVPNGVQARALTLPTEPVPAGWYADPLDATRQRYWDGATWTSLIQTGGQ